MVPAEKVDGVGLDETAARIAMAKFWQTVKKIVFVIATDGAKDFVGVFLE